MAVFLAPAATSDLFFNEIVSRPERFERFRMFTMQDDYESKDILVPYVYPRSLLYLVSGIMEEKPDSPICGMQKFLSGTDPYDDSNLIAIRDFLQNNGSAGSWGRRLNEFKPTVGDLVCWTMESGIDYDHQNNGDYRGHTDLVVEVGADRVFVIGGNVGNSVTRRPLALDSRGFVTPVSSGGETLFALMQNRIISPVSPPAMV